MPLPEGFDPQTNCPDGVRCHKCRDIYCNPTRAYTLRQTGILEQLFVCPGCLWGIMVRYDPGTPQKFVATSYISPGKSWGGIVIPKPKKKGSV